MGFVAIRKVVVGYRSKVARQAMEGTSKQCSSIYVFLKRHLCVAQATPKLHPLASEVVL